MAGWTGPKLGQGGRRSVRHNSGVEGCIFCAIAGGEADADYLHRDQTAVAIRDLNPQAPVHFLVIPGRHVETAREIDDGGMLLHMLEVAGQVAAEQGVAETGYRMVFNVGPQAGQTVYHVHLHVLGGRALGWPPG